MKDAGNIIKHKYFYKTIFFILLISLLPVAVIGILTNYSMTKVMNAELVQANTRILTLTMNTVESIISHVKNNCRIIKGEKIFSDFQRIEYAVSWYESKTEFKDHKELLLMYTYLLLKNKIFERLETELITNTYVNAVYFIDFKNNVILTSKRELYPIADFYDSNIISQLESQIGSWGLIERRAKDSQGMENNVLTIYYGSKDQGDSQIFVMNLHADGFYDYLNKNIFGNSNDIFLMVKDKKIVLASNSAVPSFNENLLRRIEPADRTLPLSWKIEDKNISYYMTAIFSNQLYWWFISLTNTSELLRTGNYAAKMLVTISVILMIFVLSSTIIWSLNWYKPIRSITARILRSIDQKALPERFSKNELNFIEYEIQKIFIERDFLQNKITRMIPFFKEKYILSLIKGTAVNQLDSIVSSDNYLSPLLPQNLSIIVMQIEKDNADEEKGFEGNMTLLVYTMEIIHSLAPDVTKHYFVLLDDFERIVLMLNIEKNNKQPVFDFCGKIREQVNMLLRSLCYIGISRNHDTIEDLPEAYSEAQQALSYSVIFPDSFITYIEDIQFYKASQRNKFFQLPLSFFTAIRAGRGDDAINQLLTYIQTVGISEYDGTGIRINDVFIYLISKFFDLTEELNINNDAMIKRLSQINNELLQRNEIAALEDAKSFIKDISAVYRDGIKVQNNNRVSKAKQILEESYTSAAVSLTTVADMVGLNPDYLGRIFREDTGMSFVNYLTNLRIQKSIEMLNTTVLQIKEISLAVGYNNPNYFIKVFKERIGVTPKEFKGNLQ
jgi:AraC-like DNA-binding protein